MHGIVDGYIGRSTTHISDDDTLKQLPNPSKSILATDLVQIFQESIQQNDLKHLQSKFSKPSTELLECIMNVTTVRMDELFQESKKRSILAGLPDSLQDFDWSLRVCRIYPCTLNTVYTLYAYSSSCHLRQSNLFEYQWSY